MAWVNRYVADVRAIGAIGERSTRRDEDIVFTNEELEPTVREDLSEFGCRLVAERRTTVERFKLVPINVGLTVRPGEGHGRYSQA